MKKLIFLLLAVFLVLAVGCAKSENKDNTKTNDQSQNQNQTQQDKPVDKTDKKTVTIETDKGNIVMELYPKEAPLSVANFVKLVNKGFYNGLTFHRVEDWVVQGGDPTGTGSGGAGENVKAEFNNNLHHDRGVLGMARSQDPDSASSQFYIVKQQMRQIDGQYTLFGTVVEGMDVVDKLAVGDKMNKVTVK